MANHRDPDWLLGRRFRADFRVTGVSGKDSERTVSLRLSGKTPSVIVVPFDDFQRWFENGVISEHETEA